MIALLHFASVVECLMSTKMQIVTVLIRLLQIMPVILDIGNLLLTLILYRGSQ